MKKITIIILCLFLGINFTKAMLPGGTYTINYQLPTSGNNYQTFSDAINALSTGITGGNVYFIVTEGIYAEQLNFLYPASADTVFFISAPANDVIISFVPIVDNWVANIGGAVNLYFDGITFSNETVSAGNLAVINFSDTNDNIAFKNCIFSSSSIFSSADFESLVYHSAVDLADVTNNLKFIDCTFYGGYNGLNLSAYNQETGLIVDNCTFQNQNNFGINITSQAYSLIQNCLIVPLSIPTNTGGIVTNFCTDLKVLNNEIKLSGSTNNYGIIFNNSEVSGIDKNEIINNMISINSGTNESFGINLNYANGINAFHNSVNVQSGNFGAAINVAGSGFLDISIMNNIFSTYGGIYNYQIESADAINICDYNLIFNLSESIGFINLTDYYYSFNEWQDGTFFDANSYYGDPNFIAADDLHLNTYTIAESAGIQYFPPVYNDIDLEPRFGDTSYIGTGSAPDLGADEGDYISIITGYITETTHWDTEVYLSGDVIVDNDAIVYINPGTHVFLVNDAQIIVNGSIFAIGNASQRIVFEPVIGNNWTGFKYFSSTDTSSSTFRYCDFLGAINGLSPSEGGVFTISILPVKDLIIEHCKFEGNNSFNGGAIYCSDGQPFINANLFSSNNAGSEGGAIYLTSSAQPHITNNIFNFNTSDTNGGAVSFDNNFIEIKLINNTFYFNSASLQGQTINSNTSTVSNKLFNNIIWGQGGVNMIFDNYNNLHAYYNNISNLAGVGGNFLVDSVNIDIDPIFIDPASLDFNLDLSSPSINAGFPETQLLLYSPLDYYGFYRYISGIVDIGAIEFQQAGLIFAYAGEDQILCSDFCNMNANVPAVNESGTWTILAGGGDIANIYDPYTIVYNLSSGTNMFRWNVADSFEIVSDDVIITNNLPFVDAGPDQFLISDIYPNLISATTLNGNMPLVTASGFWLLMSGNGTFSNNAIPNCDITDMTHGENKFQWQIYDFNTNCQNSDVVSIFTGYNIIPEATVTDLVWDEPADWYPPIIPGLGDSVTIYGINASIDGFSAEIGTLFIGTGANMFLGGAKGAGNLTVVNLRIEENPVKFPEVKGLTNLHLTNGTITIYGQDDESLPGIYLGTGASLEIGSTIAKGLANINVGYGRSIVMEQTAEKGVTKGGSSLTVRNGGSLVMEQTAEKSAKSSAGNLTIRNGGSLVMEQTAEKAGGGISVGYGRSIVMEQTAEKFGAAPTLKIRGGSLVMEQTAEKGFKGNAGGIYVRGGSLVMEQTAEKSSVPSVIFTPLLNINGGKVIIGDNSGVKSAANKIYGRSLVMEQTAEKGLSQDTMLLIYGNGGFYISNFVNDFSEHRISNGAVVTLMDGAVFDLFDGIETHDLIIEEGSSFIDYNSVNPIKGKIIHSFITDEQQYFCVPLEVAPISDFDASATVKGWDEATSVWFNLGMDDEILPLQGSKVSYPFDYTQILSGIFNTGTQSIEVYRSAIDPILQGINCAGNPYPSSIDWDKITLNSDIHKTVYFYDPLTWTISMYQQGGVSLNGADQFILPTQAFLIKTDNTTNFVIDNSSRVHYFEGIAKEEKVFNNFIKIKVENSLFSDETVIRFLNGASSGFENENDAIKIFANVLPTPQLYSYAGTEPLAINTMDVPASDYSVPVSLRTTAPGQYTISVSEIYFPVGVNIYLKNLQNNEIQDLRANPIYNFNLINPIGEYNFELQFVGVTKIEESINDELNIYSFGKDIYLNLNSNLNVNYEVYDLNGKLLLSDRIKNQGINMISTDLSSGIYFIKVTTEKFTVNKKLFIN